MNEERHSEQSGERHMQNERDSQLSAMFDGELPAAECELLARRLSRDEALRSQWSRYSMIGAALRAERGVKLDDRVAKRVQAALAQDPAYGDSSDNTASRPAINAARASAQGWMTRFARPAVGAGIAAGVAAVSIFWLRGQDPQNDSTRIAATQTPATVAPAAAAPATASSLSPVASAGESDYTTPTPSSQPSIVPPARLANYVVAHSEYSGPLSRRMALLSVVGSENPTDANESDDTEPVESAGAADAP